MTLLALEGITCSHDGVRDVLSEISLSIAAGEIVCLIGPNGAGKSTLLSVAAGLLEPSRGHVDLDGARLSALSRRSLATRLAYLPQDYSLVFPFTVFEVVLMGRYPHRSALSLETEDDVELARLAMARCDVAELGDRRFDELSGGERRRALLAQAFCQAAEILLLDEPTSSLDPAHALAFFRALTEDRRARSTGALVATHDLGLAVRFADRIVALDGGRVAACGPPREVLAQEAVSRAFGVRLCQGLLPDGQPWVVPW